jgi:hypothetical protein
VSAWDSRPPAGHFYLTSARCPCYCGGEGLILLVACPTCGTVVGRCDEVDELIRDVRNPHFDSEESVCYPDQPCPLCGEGRYGDFRPATAAELLALGLRRTEFRAWRP